MTEHDIIKYEDNLNKLHRKFNLLSSWLQLKFPNDSSFPRSLIHDSTELDKCVGAEYANGVTEKHKSLDDTNISPIKLVDIQSILEGDFGDTESMPLSIGGSEESFYPNLKKFGPCEQIQPCSVYIQRLDSSVTIFEEPNNLSVKDESEFAPFDATLKDDTVQNGTLLQAVNTLYQPKPEPVANYRSSNKKVLKIMGRDATAKTSIKVNIIRKRSNINHQCQKCEEKFSSKATLKNHIAKYHSLNTKNSNHTTSVEIIKHGPRNLAPPCQFCHKVYKGRKYLRIHILQRHGDEPGALDAINYLTKQAHHDAVCQICDRKFVHFTNFKIHLQQRHPEVYEQKLQSGEIRENTKSTMSTTSTGIISELDHHVKCADCSKMILSSYLKTHMRYVHEQQNKLFLCSKCGFTTKRKSLLESHVETHSDVKKYKCDHCPYAAKHKTALRIHKIRLHDPTRTDHQCNLCGELFKTTYTLKNHVARVHENLRSYRCNLCEKAFKSSTHLKYHVKTHQNPNGRKRGLNKDREPKRRAPNRSQNI